MSQSLCRSRRSWLLSLCLLFLLGAVVACTPQAAEAPPSEIKIGVLATLSGDLKDAGKFTVEGAELAVQQINDAGGLEVGGQRYRVALVVEDDAHVPETAVAAANQLINRDNVVALVGPNFSTDAIPVSEIAEAAHIPMISPGSTNPKTTAGKQYVFRVAFLDPFQGQVMATFAREELKVERAAVLYDIASDYNRGIAEIFKEVFEAGGGEVVAFESYTSDQNQDFSDQLAVIKESDAEIIFLPNYASDLPQQVQQVREMEIDATLIGSDAWGGQEGLPELEEGFYTSLWAADVATEQNRAFIDAYRTKYGREPEFTAAVVYDAFGLLFEAMRRQGKVDAESIRAGLADVGPFEGVTGSISYEGSGDPIKSAPILQVKEGQAVFYRMVSP